MANKIDPLIESAFHTSNHLSKYFNFNINKIILPKPINIDTVEEYQKNYDNIKKFCPENEISTINSYNDNLVDLEKVLEIDSHSLHFNLFNGPERMKQLCKKEKSNMIKSYCSSFFRNPYYLNLIILIMIILSVILGCSIYTKRSFNLYEIPMIEKSMLEEKIKHIKEYGIPTHLLPVETVFRIYNSFWQKYGTGKCFSKSKPTHSKLCFNQNELKEGNYNWTNLFFDNLDIDTNKTSQSEIKKILKKMLYTISIFPNLYYESHVNDLGFFHRYEKYEFVLFRMSRIHNDSSYGTLKCMNPDGIIKNKERNQVWMWFETSLIEYDAACIANIIIDYPYLKLDIWYLILILVSIWIVLIGSILYAFLSI
jgi:hypothetical protein